MILLETRSLNLCCVYPFHDAVKQVLALSMGL